MPSKKLLGPEKHATTRHNIGLRGTLHPAAQRSEYATRQILLADEEEGAALRSKFARDRDRIAFCKSFRRLAHKTQLYISHEGNEHKRTRLTHTIEVALIARAIAKTVRANEELTEAIAFGHDVGHAPFGHAGEKQIDRFLGGKEEFPRRIKDRIRGPSRLLSQDSEAYFKHNYQSVRILSFLEDYHPGYQSCGLNLTIPCLEGILKHTSTRPNDKEKANFHFPGMKDKANVFSDLHVELDYPVSLEGQIVNIADELAQVTHDLNDALEIGALSIERLCEEVAIQEVIDQDKLRFPALTFACKDPENKQLAQIMSALLNHLIRYCSDEFNKSLESVEMASATSKQKRSRNPVTLNRWLLQEETIDQGNPAYQSAKRLKNDVVLNNYLVNRMDSKGEYIVRNLFEAYLSNPRQLPDSVLDQYCSIKQIELNKKGLPFFYAWVKERTRDYDISDALTQKETKEIMDVISAERDGREMRLIPAKLLEKATPYLAVDADFLRCIADYISSMTDVFAMDEFVSLYR